ncbi:MAG: chemotaxis protein CheW, partial [Deltaproteobacteria bacterium]|nr:chemotaxis protein CheW [Deltaproteobacteria bacterium]
SDENQSGDETVQLAAFAVGEEEYVVDIMRVREILRPVPVTPVRRGPQFVEGVINLRGTVIPVVDLRRRFDLKADDHPRRRILIVSIDGRLVGLVVDRVTEVVRTPRSAIRTAPALVGPERAPYFLGICPHKGRTLILLNVKAVVASDEAISTPSAADLIEPPAPE